MTPASTPSVNARVADAAGFAASLTRNVMLADTGDRGVPLSTPPVLSARPAGNDPLATDHRYGCFPPEAWSVALYNAVA